MLVLKEGSKQNLILLVFSFMMFEVLTLSTLAFSVGGMLLVSLDIKLNKAARNAIALAIFASYWLKYGKIIDPEVGLNFLTTIIVIKILEKETIRDRYMIFFGLLLLISAGALFEKTLSYVLFFGFSFMLLIRDFYSFLEQKLRFKDLGQALLWVLPLTFIIFFLVPRIPNPIPFQQSRPQTGELGYDPNVNISQIESLTSNPRPVFQVLVNQNLNQADLYWRGNTLSYNDGWNWPKMLQDVEEPSQLLGSEVGPNEVKQTFRIYKQADYFFTLDTPRVINIGKETFGLKQLRSMAQKRWEWVPKYEVISRPGALISTNEKPRDQYLQVSLPKTLKKKIRDLFPGESVEDVGRSIRTHFIKEKFSYSLSPGRSQSLGEFLEKKIGLCSHYASATALILRVKGIPSRLVSGYMGGNFNRFANFYLISENDAHVWVEAYDNGVWRRLDPTEWISPDRIQLGGEAFMENIQDGKFGVSAPLFKLPRFVKEMRLWFGQWDFLFYQWIEETDYHAQESWLQKFNFQRRWLFSIIPLLLVVFMLIYSWFLYTKRTQEEVSAYQELWSLLFKRLHKRGLVLSRHSLKESEQVVMAQNDPKLHDLWRELVDASFGGKVISVNELKRKIKKI